MVWYGVQYNSLSDKNGENLIKMGPMLEGYKLMNGNLFEGSDLVICYKGTSTFLLKGLSDDQAKNAFAIKDLRNRIIVEFELYRRELKHCRTAQVSLNCNKSKIAGEYDLVFFY